MGSDIYDRYQVAKDVLDQAEEHLQFNLKELMFHGPQVSQFYIVGTKSDVKCTTSNFGTFSRAFEDIGK